MSRIKQGFTIIEILISISLILIVSITGFVIFSKVIENSKQKEYNRIAAEFESAGEVWLHSNNEKNEKLKHDLYNTKGTYHFVYLKDLSANNLIDDKIKNPINGEEFNYEKEYVKLYYDDIVEDNEKTELVKGLKSEFNARKTPGIIVDKKIYYIADYNASQKFDQYKNVSFIDEDGDAIKKEEAISSGAASCDFDNNKYLQAEPYTVECSFRFEYNGKMVSRHERYVVQYNSSIDGEYYYSGTEITKKVNIPRTFKFYAEGAKGKDGDNKGAKLQAEIKLEIGDYVKIIVGGQQSLYGGGKDGAGGTTYNGGDPTRVYVKKKGESNYILALSAAGGGGGSGATAITSKPKEITGSQEVLNSPAGGIGETNGQPGQNGGGSGGSNKTKYCSEMTINGTCKEYKSCSSCNCASWNQKIRAKACGCQTCKTYYKCSSSKKTKSCSCDCKSWGTKTTYTYYWGSSGSNNGSKRPDAGISKCKSGNVGKYNRYNIQRYCYSCVRNGTRAAPSCNYPGNNKCKIYKYKWKYKECKRKIKSKTSYCKAYDRQERKKSCGCQKCKTYYECGNSKRTKKCKCKKVKGKECLKYKRCKKCGCETYNRKNIKCLPTGTKKCEDKSLNPVCKTKSTYFGAGKGGQNIINKSLSITVKAKGTATYKKSAQSNNGYLKIEAEVPKV